MKKIAILIGHRSAAQGAHSPYLGLTEYQYHKKVVAYLETICKDYEIVVYERANTPMVSEGYRIAQVVNKINQSQYDLVLSLHFNSFTDPTANGCTALHYITNRKTKAIAQRFVDLVHEQFSIKKRALIAIQDKSQRGGTFIVNSKAPAVLLEPFFGSNPSDSYSFNNRELEYAQLIDQLIKESV